MIDLPLIILIALAHTSLALLISYVAWLILRANILRSRPTEEEYHA